MTDKVKIIELLKQSDDFTAIDLHFAMFIADLAKSDSPELLLAAAIASREIRQGDICVDLGKYAETKLTSETDEQSLAVPELEQWLAGLRNSGVVGKPGEFKPLVLDDHNRLYLYRWWEYEHKLGTILKTRAGALIESIETRQLKDSLSRMFPADSAGEFDYQKLAAFVALTHRLCVITGGPGTGKTSTVTKILALLLEQDSSLRIALATPTGKAAARLQESITSAVPRLDCADRIKELIPRQTSTIHRLLGTIRNSPYFKYNAANRLPYDVVVIDEASMVDLALMSKLTRALPDDSRLILIGDKDQLASVESGAVLGDICGVIDDYTYSREFANSYMETTGVKIPIAMASKYHPLRDNIVELQHSYRFGGDSGIGQVSRAINRGDYRPAIRSLQDHTYADTRFVPLPDQANLVNSMRETIIENYSAYLKADNPQTALELFNRFRILGAIQKGPYGIEAINYHCRRILDAAGLIEPRGQWYKGRPVMITRNDYRLNLYNGDIGIIFPDRLTPCSRGTPLPRYDPGVVRK